MRHLVIAWCLVYLPLPTNPILLQSQRLFQEGYLDLPIHLQHHIRVLARLSKPHCQRKIGEPVGIQLDVEEARSNLRQVRDLVRRRLLQVLLLEYTGDNQHKERDLIRPLPQPH